MSLAFPGRCYQCNAFMKAEEVNGYNSLFLYFLSLFSGEIDVDGEMAGKNTRVK